MVISYIQKAVAYGLYPQNLLEVSSESKNETSIRQHETNNHKKREWTRPECNIGGVLAI